MDMMAVHGKLAEDLGHVPWYEGNDVFESLIVALGTSAGKTVCAAKLVETLISLGKRIMFCADTNELCQQPLNKIRQATGIYPTLEKADERAARAAAIVVASVQNLGVNG